MGLFSEIPLHNQNDILKKLDFKEFINFKKCSKATVENTKNFKHRLCLKLLELNFHENDLKSHNGIRKFYVDTVLTEPVRIEAKRVYPYASHSTGISLDDFCRDAQMSAELVCVLVRNIDTHVLYNALKVLKPTVLSICFYPSADFTNLLEFRKVKELYFAEAQMAESDFLLLEASKITLRRTNLTVPATNKFLKQWVEGKRRIEELAIEPFPKNPRQHLEMFDGIEYSTHYNNGGLLPVDVGDSLREILYIYSITTEDGKNLFIAIDQLDDDPFNPFNKPLRVLVGEFDANDLEGWMRSKYTE